MVRRDGGRTGFSCRWQLQPWVAAAISSEWVRGKW